MWNGFIRHLLVFLTNHNILLVKLFQVLSTNQHVSPKFLHFFRECTNNYSCYSADVDHELLDEVLQTYQLTLCDNKPINAGMIALVYKCYRVNDGKCLAIKMKRKNIENRLLAGYKELFWLYKIAVFLCWPFAKLYSILNLVKGFMDNKDHIMDQCDFGLEIKAMNTFNWEFSELENIKHSDNIVVPMVYNRDDESRYIVMDFLEGVDCFHIPESDKEDYLQLICSCQVVQVLFTTIIHVDPHPGNIVYMNVDGVKKIGVIDFGMHAYIDTDVKTDVAKGLSSIVVKSSTPPITYIRNLTTPPIQLSKYSDEIFNRLNKEAELIVQMFDDGTTNEQKIIECYVKIKQIHPDFANLELNRDLVRMMLALSSLLTTGLYLCNHDKERYATTLKAIIFDLVS
jgi:predicted unusual protein kinase regulating ubiquinone biosynthesis (AarF/ABC1/UbiB family)